jgi:hypothetical protein
MASHHPREGRPAAEKRACIQQSTDDFKPFQVEKRLRVMMTMRPAFRTSPTGDSEIFGIKTFGNETFGKPTP